MSAKLKTKTPTKVAVLTPANKNVKTAPAIPQGYDKKNSAANEGNFFDKKAKYIIAALMIVALIIRLYRLDYQAFWVDEYIHSLDAKHFLETHSIHFSTELNQMMVSVLNCLFVAVLGFSDFVCRLPIVLCSVVAIPVIYVFSKKTFGHTVGLIAAFLMTFSQFYSFWARVDRAYGMIAPLYILMALFFWMMLHPDKDKPHPNRFVHYCHHTLGFHPKYAGYFVLTFVVAFLTQIQVFLFVFTMGFFGTFLFFDSFSKPQPRRFVSVNALLFYMNIVLVCILCTPLVEVFMRPIIEMFMSPKMATLILPNWASIKVEMASDKWNKSFLTYIDLIKNDYVYLYFLGVSGFVLSFYMSRRAAYYLLALFVPPILIMGFLLREPNLAKYMAFYYPVFFVAAAVALKKLSDIIGDLLQKYASLSVQKTRIIMTFFVIGVLLAFIPYKALNRIMTTTEFVQIVSKEIAEVSYVPWNKYCAYVGEHIQDGDIILTTLPNNVEHYLGGKDHKIFQFRQRVLEPKTRTFVQMPITEDIKNADHAYSFEGLQQLFNKYKRGWFIADYYFYNPLTDPQAADFCIKNMNYHFWVGEEGLIKIFSWDHDHPKTTKTPILIELGKAYSTEDYVVPLEFTLNKNILQSPLNLQVCLLYDGIESADEAYILINKKHILPITVTPQLQTMNGIQVPVINEGLKYIYLNLNKQMLVEGKNVFEIKAGRNSDKNFEGFVIQDLYLKVNQTP